MVRRANLTLNYVLFLARTAPARYGNLGEADALHVQIVYSTNDLAKITCLHEAPPKQEFIQYYGIFRFGQ